jgi:PKHD-type hydroxylase
MTYKTISNYPEERRNITHGWCYWDNAFTTEELDKACAYFETQDLDKGAVVGDEKNNARVSNIKFYNWDPKNENTAWIFQKMNNVITTINNQYYGFDLNGYNSFQYTEYEASEKGKYDWHMDTILGGNKPNNLLDTRKLSVTMCVNEPGDEYKGGEFQINNGSEKECETITTKKGRMIIFPSFIIHRVAPITKGKRKSIVVWVEGPKFK